MSGPRAKPLVGAGSTRPWAHKKSGENGTPPAIEIENLTVGYEDRPALLTGFSLTVQPGELIAVAGESGCGKSTLLRCVCGLIPRGLHAIMTGAVRLFGRPVAEMTRLELTRTIGIVFQDPDTQLFCDTVADELAFGLENICLPRKEMSRRVEECLAATGLAQYRLVSPKRLSGGQKQLVALASVLALRPRILLLDEAFSQLDQPGRAQLLAHITALSEAGRTVVLADHEPESLPFVHRVVRLGRPDGG